MPMVMRSEFRTLRPRRRRGSFIVEAAVAIALIAMLFAVVARVVIEFRSVRARAVAQQIAAHAADVQVERLRAGAAIESVPPDGFMPSNVELQTKIVPGEGEWAGLRLVTVTSIFRPIRGKPARAEVRCYLPAERRP